MNSLRYKKRNVHRKTSMAPANRRKDPLHSIHRSQNKKAALSERHLTRGAKLPRQLPGVRVEESSHSRQAARSLIRQSAHSRRAALLVVDFMID